MLHTGLSTFPISVISFLSLIFPMVQPHETEPSSLIALANPDPSSDLAATPNHEVVRQQINVAKAVLNQAVDLVDNHLTSDEQLTVNSKYISGSTIGKMTCPDWP
jgi:hypothetical protein